MASGLTDLNKALNQIPKRAESRQAEQLRETFVDSGVSASLETIDHQVMYGRRGTGKTHALRYLESQVAENGDIAVYCDLRTVGSPEGIFAGDATPTYERAARIMADVLGHFHDAVLEAALADETLVSDPQLIDQLDNLMAAVSSVRVAGDVEATTSGSQRRADSSTGQGSLSLDLSGASIGGSIDRTTETEQSAGVSVTRRGPQRMSLNFTDVARSLRGVAGCLNTRRVWMLFDEWSSLSQDVQPYFGAFLAKCMLPVREFTVKIAAIEQQCRFRVQGPDGRQVGLELGADISANLDLDEFMVFEQNAEKSRDFFRNLLFRHVSAAAPNLPIGAVVPRNEGELVRLGFTDIRALDELVRAAEGVPRDAINIAGKAAIRAADRRISVSDVRAAARTWFQNDKEAALAGRPEATRLLNHIIDRVIRQKRARGFLVDQRASQSELLMSLFDARVLHLVRRGYSGQDEPGVRYNVYVIDYGAYVDLMLTQNAPLGVLSGDDGQYVEVPTQDLRAIRRAILDLDSFVG